MINKRLKQQKNEMNPYQDRKKDDENILTVIHSRIIWTLLDNGQLGNSPMFDVFDAA